MAVAVRVLDSLANVEWLALGAVLGVIFTVIAAGSFLLGERLYPTAATSTGSYRSGETRRREEIRRYLDAIDEPFAETRTIGDVTVDFYLPERDIAITFDPRAYFELEDARTHVVLAEHEMPGFQLGRRLPFETPSLEGPDPTTDAAFAVLGLPTDADATEVTAAYRRKLKAVHPDHGGDREAFQRVRDAYDTAREHAE